MLNCRNDDNHPTVVVSEPRCRPAGTIGANNSSVANISQLLNLSLTSSSDVLIRKLQTILDLREADIGVLKGIPIQEGDYLANQDLVREGDCPVYSFIVLDGLVGSTKHTGEGKREVTSLFGAATFLICTGCICRHGL